ncbi:hypothetical protein M1N19_02575 [Dehalococcoidia bacterium]|nr:hypothetical protein [Dehalococcoidia bacterium]
MPVATYSNNPDVRLEEMPVSQVGPGELPVKMIATIFSFVLPSHRLKPSLAMPKSEPPGLSNHQDY